MNAEFYPIYLAHVFDWTEPIHDRLNWLFVVLDSNRDILITEKYLGPELKQQGVQFEYKPEGLWIFSSKVVKSYVRDGIAVPFSACYIFNKRVKDCPRPSFKRTPDQGFPFSDTDISNVIAEIKSLNAIGYAADGGGLQWVSFDDELSHLIRQGFASWQKAAKKKT